MTADVEICYILYAYCRVSVYLYTLTLILQSEEMREVAYYE